jgi:hypothetical protein
LTNIDISFTTMEVVVESGGLILAIGVHFQVTLLSSRDRCDFHSQPL